MDEGGTVFMLPGFRFLFVAVVLSMSTLVFGVGAAALLRSAHEEFVNLPGRRPLPEAVFAQRIEIATPTLAMLRIDTPVPAGSEPSLISEAPKSAAPEQSTAAASITVEVDKLGAPVPSVSAEQPSEAAAKPSETPV